MDCSFYTQKCWSGRLLRVALGYFYLAVTRRSFNFAKFPTKSTYFSTGYEPGRRYHCCLVWMSQVTTKSMLRQSITVSIVGWSSVSRLDVTVHDKERIVAIKHLNRSLVDCMKILRLSCLLLFGLQLRNSELELRLDVTESRSIKGIAIKHLDRNSQFDRIQLFNSSKVVSV